MRCQLHLLIKQMEKIRKKRERYWMQTLNTMEPYGLNIPNSVKSAHALFRLFIDYYFQFTITFIVYYFYGSLDLFYLILFFIFYFLFIYFLFIILFLSLLPLFSYNS